MADGLDALLKREYMKMRADLVLCLLSFFLYFNLIHRPLMIIFLRDRFFKKFKEILTNNS